MAIRLQTRKKSDPVLDLKDLFKPMARIPPTGITMPNDWIDSTSETDFNLLFSKVSTNIHFINSCLINNTLDLGYSFLQSENRNLCCSDYVEINFQ